MRYLYLIVLILLLVSCTHNFENSNSKTKITTAKSKGLINIDSMAPPVTYLIHGENSAQIIKAKSPILMPNPLRNGVGSPIFTNYGTEDGLALSTVQCGLEDKNGNIWWGTNGGGASRYDGKSFTTFTTANGLGENTIRYIMEDKSGNLWFASWGGGIYCYNGKYFKTYTTADGLVSNLVNCIIEDKKGKIWISTEGGVSRLDPFEDKLQQQYSSKIKPSFTNFTIENGLISNSIFFMLEDTKGNIWLASNKDGVSCFNGQSFINYTIADGLPGNNVWSIFEDKQDRIWFGTENGASCYIPASNGLNNTDTDKSKAIFKNYTTKDGLLNNFIHYILDDKNGNLWFATYGGGISIYNGKEFTNYTTSDGLANDLVYCITEDNSGNLWFGTFGGGISRYDGQSLSYFGLGNGEMPFGILADKQDQMWFGSFGRGIFKNDGKYLKNYNTDHGLVNNSINIIYEDKTGQIWAGTENGISCFDGQYFTNYSTKQGLANNRIFGIVEDKAGYLWFSSYGGGISKFDGNIIKSLERGETVDKENIKNLKTSNGKYIPSFTNYTTAQGLPSNNIRQSIIDKKNELWIGTGNAGISHFNGKIFENFNTSNGLNSNVILSLMEDKKGNIWIGTSGKGIRKYDGHSFVNYTTNEGLADNVVYVTTEDTINNIIWIGTNLGLSALKLNPKQDKKQEFEIYNTNTGYPIKDLNSNALFVDKKGILWAGCGDSKVIRFDYKSLNKNLQSSLLQIEHISINNEPTCWYNLKTNSNSTSMEDSLTILNEMLCEFGNVLSPLELQEQKIQFNRIQFDSVSNFNYIPSGLILPYEHNNISFDFTAIEPTLGKQMKYQYMLEGYDKEWSPLNHKTSANFGNINEGSHIFRVKSLSPFGTWSELAYSFKVLPPWNRTWWAYILYIITISGLFYIVYRWRTSNLRHSKILLENKVEKRTEQLKAEKKKSDDLLLNILPSEIADELKQNGTSAARLYNHVTVLFTDFVNFTGISEEMNPSELVKEIHKNFTEFDAIIEKNGLEKIKTIGDAYLAVCGLPNELPDHAQRVIKAGLDIIDFIDKNNSKFQIRIGIHSGPVVAGIVGVKKFAYDIWGDTVNTANRMESCSEAGKINISGTTYDLIKGEFKCSYRGKIDAKNKGEIDMYFVNLKD